MTEMTEQDMLHRGQSLYDLRNSPAWPVLQEILIDIDRTVVAQWRAADHSDTAKVLALHAKANAVNEVLVSLLSRVDEEIEIALQILNQNSSQF